MLFGAKNNCDCDFTVQKEHTCIGFAKFYSDEEIKFSKEDALEILNALFNDYWDEFLVEEIDKYLESKNKK